MTELIVALDFPETKSAFKLIDSLKTQSLIYKIGSELFLAGGPSFVKTLTETKNRVFLDLKFYDIPNTVSKSVLQAASLGVEMLTVHLLGGKKMITTILEELGDVSTPPKILGVTVLTSYDEKDWQEVASCFNSHPSPISKSVLTLTKRGVSWGINGLVCSAQELKEVRSLFPDLYTVVPGIRPTGHPNHDQSRVLTPLEAKKLGTSAIVMGRPITQAKCPNDVVESVLKEISDS